MIYIDEFYNAHIYREFIVPELAVYNNLISSEYDMELKSFFAKGSGYECYYHSADHINTYDELRELWTKYCPQVYSDNMYGILPRAFGRRQASLNAEQFHRLWINHIYWFKGYCTQEMIYGSYPIWTIVTDYASIIRDIKRQHSIPSIIPSIGWGYWGYTEWSFAAYYDMVNNLRCFRYAGYTKYIEVRNLHWDADRLIFFKGSELYGYMPICIARRNW